MNTVSMTGRLTKDPDLKHVGDRAICEMRLAVDNGRHPTTYIDVVTFDGQAYACAEYLSKGSRAGADGKLALNEWRDAGGRLHHRYKVIGRVEFLGWRRPDRVEEAPIGPPADDADATAPDQPELALAV